LLLFALGGRGYSQGAINLDIRIQDSIVESAALFKKLQLTNPLSVRYSAVYSKIEQIIGFYENTGYPFVQVSFDSVSPVPSGISGILWIRPGDLVTIDTIMNRTGFKISSPVLYRLMNIRPGDRYRETVIREASSRLGQLSYIKQARPLEVGFHPGKASVYVYPEKAGTNRFDGWIGLSPDLRAVGKLAFSGKLALTLNNILNQGENMLFDWQRNQDGSQRLNLGAHIPYLAGLPLGLQGKFELFRQDTSYLNLGWDVGIPYHFSPRHLINVFLRHRESSMISSVADDQNSSRQPFSSLLSGISWELNHLDNAINPYKGLEVKIEASTGRKSIPDSISVQQSEFTADISWFRPLAKNLTCALVLQSGYRKSPQTYENEQYRLGGLNLLRGFDEDVIHTDAYAVTSLELRYLLDRSSYLIALADLGFLRGTDNAVPVLRTPAGFGLGGQIRTAGGIFKIIFALGKESGLPIDLRNSKIHIGYVGVF
jgi:outer membrane protein assembly factor BamA